MRLGFALGPSIVLGEVCFDGDHRSGGCSREMQVLIATDELLSIVSSSCVANLELSFY